MILFSLHGVTGVQAQSRKEMMTIDDNFPGGNIIVDSVKGKDIYIHHDLHDTERNWFYWYFRIKGASGSTRTFHFTHPWQQFSAINVVGVHGPAISRDGGITWSWLGMENATGKSFTYTFSGQEKDVRFSMGMPYTQENLTSFLDRYKNNKHLDIATLAVTRKGRIVERIHVGNTEGNPKYRILLTARHHACEMMTNYLLEGVIETVLGNAEQSAWLRKNVEFLVVPFVDKDGVEDGDQGKYRRARDHNRDYSEESIYASTRAIRAYVPVWSDEKLAVMLDLHCPYIAGKDHEQIHMVGLSSPGVSKQQEKFSSILQRTSESGNGLPYQTSFNIPFGTSWNTVANYGKGKSISRWASELKEVKLASTLEFPYANASGKIVTQENARDFGRILARSLYEYLLLLEKE